MANNYWDRLKQLVTGVKTTTTTTSTTVTLARQTNNELTQELSKLTQNECSKVWDKTLGEAFESFESFEEDFTQITPLTGEFDF